MKICEHGQRYDRPVGLDGLVAERVELDAAGVPAVDLSTGYEQARCCPGWPDHLWGVSDGLCN